MRTTGENAAEGKKVVKMRALPDYVAIYFVQHSTTAAADDDDDDIWKRLEIYTRVLYTTTLRHVVVST